jgi:hypothetical protein
MNKSRVQEALHAPHALHAHGRVATPSCTQSTQVYPRQNTVLAVQAQCASHVKTVSTFARSHPGQAT